MCTTSAGSLTFCFRTGSGDRYGASVSTTIRSAASSRAASRSPVAFLNVITPVNPMK